MSLILDALRKAEAERKLGRAPTLATVSPWRVQRRVPFYGVVLIILLGAVVVLGGVLWFSSRRAEPPPAAQAPSRTAATEPAARMQPAPAPTATPKPATPERGPAPVPAAKPAARPVPPSERLPTVVPSGPPVPHLEPEQIAPARPDPATPTPATPAAPHNVLPQLPQQASAAPGLAPQEVPAAPATLPSHVNPMSAAARTALGELKLSLHYYNADPARRFVILDGERYGEGQSTGKGLKIAEIRADGVLCEYQGESFFLARGGG